MQPSVPPLSNIADGSSLLFQQIKPVEKMEILASLPPKPEVDRLIAYFFDDPSYPIRVPRTFTEPSGSEIVFTNATPSHPAQTDLYARGMESTLLQTLPLTNSPLSTTPTGKTPAAPISSGSACSSPFST